MKAVEPGRVPSKASTVPQILDVTVEFPSFLVSMRRSFAVGLAVHSAVGVAPKDGGPAPADVGRPIRLRDRGTWPSIKRRAYMGHGVSGALDARCAGVTTAENMNAIPES